MRKLLLGKKLCAQAFVPGIHGGESTDNLSRHRIRNFSFATVPDYTQLKNKEHLCWFFFSSPNWNAFLCLLCLPISYSFFRKGVSSSENSAWASQIPPASSFSLSICLEPIRLFPAPPCAIAVTHKSHWISSRGKGIATCDFVPYNRTRMPYPEQWFIIT